MFWAPNFVQQGSMCHYFACLANENVKEAYPKEKRIVFVYRTLGGRVFKPILDKIYEDLLHQNIIDGNQGQISGELRSNGPNSKLSFQPMEGSSDDLLKWT